MTKVRVSTLKVDVPYRTKLGELVDVLTELYLKSGNMYVSTPEELVFCLDAEEAR